MLPASPAPNGGGPASDRIGSLDVLRGIALLGMFLVHFNDQAAAGSGLSLDAVYARIVTLFFEERFWTMFGILFGIGFAVQLRRADARGGPFVPRYVRRLLALAALGVFTHVVLGYHVLLEYAAWGFPLMLVRRWPVRPLMLALLISASSWPLYSIARMSRCVVAVGESACGARISAEVARNRTFNQTNRTEQDAPHYPAVVAARIRHVAWFYAQPFFFLPMNNFTLFLLGVIALRLGLLEKPDEHRRLIVALMVFGVASWAAVNWGFPTQSDEPGGSLVRAAWLAHLTSGFGLIRGTWLTFTYMGAVLLLVARNPQWLHRLAAFGWTGRMALTNYVVQVAILDLVFSNYALHLTPTPLQGLVAGLLLFAADAAFSRWWLTRFRFGPFEWLWRSVTYGRRQPWRTGSPAAAGIA